MCNSDNPAARCICREEFGERVCAPSLPAAGSAVPAFSVVCKVCNESSSLDERRELSGCCWSCGHEIDLDPYLRAALSAQQSAPEPVMEQTGKLLVSAAPLRKVLGALIGAPHMIRELQATREPVALFADNPINVLIAEFNAAHGGEK